MDGWMHNGKWIDGRTMDNQWMNGWMDAQMENGLMGELGTINGWMDGWMDAQWTING
jgi:hypothetical protein